MKEKKAKEGRKEEGRKLRLGGKDVLDDEHALTGTDQAEVAAGDFFDGRRIVGQPPDFVAEPAVVGTLARDGCRHHVVVAPCPQHRQQPAFAHEAVNDDQGADEEDEPVNDTPRPSRGLWLARAASRRARRLVFWHATTHYNNLRQSTRLK